MFSQIKQFLEQHHVSRAQLQAILAHQPDTRDDVTLLKDTAQKLYSNSQTHSVPKTDLTGMVDFLQDTFGFETDASQGSRSVLTLSARLVFAAVLAVCTFYIVIGGVVGSESSLTVMYGAPVWLTLVMMLLAILLLASLEGTQIAIVALNGKKVMSFKKTYPRGCDAIKLFQNKKMVERYLAGRQFFVIFVVFVIAQVTSFPQIETLPFSDFPVQSLPSVLTFLGLQLGLFGALFVLWIGQLLPQFIANKNPLFFLNLPGMQGVIRLCLLLESLGPTRPANWFSSVQKEELIVPSSEFVKHNDLVDDVFGYEVLNQSHIWTFESAETWSLEFSNTLMVKSAGIQQFTEKSLQITGQIGDATFSNSLYREGKAIDGMLQTLGVETTTNPNQWTTFTQSVAGKQGFQREDVVQSIYNINGVGAVRQAYVDILKPTKLLSFQVRVRKDALTGMRLIAQKYRQDDVTMHKEPISSQELSFSDSDTEGMQEATFIDIHSKINTFYEIEWTCQASKDESAPMPEFVIEAVPYDGHHSSNTAR
jgi:hypothetical protein